MWQANIRISLPQIGAQIKYYFYAVIEIIIMRFDMCLHVQILLLQKYLIIKS